MGNVVRSLSCALKKSACPSALSEMFPVAAVAHVRGGSGSHNSGPLNCLNPASSEP